MLLAIPALAAVALFVALLALLQHASPAHARVRDGDQTVELTDTGINPATVTVSVGTRVVWENTSDVLTHMLVFTGGMSSPELAPNQQYSRTFDTAGTFTYSDTRFPSIIGAVIVSTGTVPESGGGAQLRIATSSDQPAAAGATVDYHVTYENTSDGTDAQNVMVTVTLPASSALVSSTPTPLSQVAGTLVYSIGTLAAQAEGHIDLQVKLPSPLPVGTDVTVSAVISASNATAQNGDHSEDHNTVSAPQLSLGVRPVEDSRFLPGGLVTYSLQYANHADNVAADNVTVTLSLPQVASFVSATRIDNTNGTTMTQLSAGNMVSFFLGTLKPSSEGRILAQLRLSSAITSGQKISITGQINATGLTGATGGGNGDGDSVITSTENVPAQATNLYVHLASSGDTDIGGTRTYRIAFGNAGLMAANNVKLTVHFVDALTNFDFGSITPTTFVSNTAVWTIPTLPMQTAAQPYVVTAKISGAGALTATASISGVSGNGEVDEKETGDTEGVVLLKLTHPTISAPNRVIVGQQQVFKGTGLANAEVSLYLSGTQSLPGRLLGTALVGLDRVWVITPSQSVAVTGWHWVTATQVLTTVVSGAAGATFDVSNTLGIDPASVTRDGVPLGGLNPKVSWRAGWTYKLGMKIVACSTPMTPTLQALWFNTHGLMTGYKNFAGTQSGSNVTFSFTPTLGTPFELYVDYYCPVVAQAAQAAQALTVMPALAQATSVVHHHDCFDAPSCVDSPIDPPEHCDDCTPDHEDRPIGVHPIDPDGYVYDAAAVRAGASITQSIIANAWITLTRQASPGIFTPWNAQSFNQANPQFSDDVYPDKVLVPGYYSFFVPPGAYKVTVTAPGFLPYESDTLVVQGAGVTLNVPLERTGGPLTTVTATPAKVKVYLPLIRR